jgi:hypothetical protein
MAPEVRVVFYLDFFLPRWRPIHEKCHPARRAPRPTGAPPGAARPRELVCWDHGHVERRAGPRPNVRAPLRRRQGRSELRPRRPSTACQLEGGRCEARPARSPARGRGRPQHPSARPRLAPRPRQRPRAPASGPAVSASTAVASPQATSACRGRAVGRELPVGRLVQKLECAVPPRRAGGRPPSWPQRAGAPCPRPQVGRKSDGSHFGVGLVHKLKARWRRQSVRSSSK